MNKRIKKKKKKQYNKKLCERYPFLIPYHRWFGNCMWKNRKSRFYVSPYSYTELDDMPIGWRRAFGIQMCEEIREELIKFNYLYEYRIAQIKEKYGELRWYDFGVPIDSKVHEIINKYTELSRHTCMICGAPAETTSDGYWVETICNKCKEKLNER